MQVHVPLFQNRRTSRTQWDQSVREWQVAVHVSPGETHEPIHDPQLNLTLQIISLNSEYWKKGRSYNQG